MKKIADALNASKLPAAANPALCHEFRKAACGLTTLEDLQVAILSSNFGDGFVSTVRKLGLALLAENASSTC